jgi:predicted ATPase/DNA-binding SARP family transcriptional activator
MTKPLSGHQRGRIIWTMGSEVAGRLKFGVLGPLEVRRDRRLVRLGGERQRTLLALLLVHANQVMSVDWLADQLFGGQRSESAVNAVRVAVSRLRGLLENSNRGSVLLTRSGGYVLEVDPERLDAAVFERLLAEGQGLLASGDPASAAACLREALVLWRGPALADVSLVECLQPEIRRLEELHLVALMDRIDAELAVGRAAELVAELESLVAAEPLQERMRGQLMLALYRAGRQADALAVYRETSELLRDELGLEPSRQLRELERSILQQEPTLEPMSRPAPPVSTTLPVSPTPFLGRSRELAEVIALLQREDTRLFTLTGAGGSGKTRLALRAAESSVSEYPDGVWFVGFADITDPELIAPTICHALEIGEQIDLTSMQRLEGWLADRRLLLVLDNLEQLAEGTSVLGELLATCAGLTLLLTSREPLHLAGERQYEVPVLEDADAVELFITRAQAVAARQVVDPELVGAICERLDYLPLAIELAAARTKALSATELLGRLEKSLPLLTGGPRDAPRRQHTLTATIDWSHDLLTGDERTLFAHLAVFAGGCTLPAAEAVCGARIDTLQALVDRSLVRSDGERYWMLQTIREYALAKLEQRAEAREVRKRHARWFVDLVAAEGSTPPGWPSDTALNHLAPEQENFRAALEWAERIADLETLARLASALTAVWVIRGQLHEATHWLTLALQQQNEYRDRLAAQVMSAGWRLARHQGKTAEAAAFAARALELWQALGDPKAITRAMLDVAHTAVTAGDVSRGRDLLEQAVSLAREHDLREILAAGLNNLADLALLEENLEEAKALTEESLRVSQPGSALADIALMNLSCIETQEGNLVAAVHSVRQALDGSLRRGDLLWVAWAAIGLAWPTALQGRFEPAARLLGAAVAFLEEAGAGRDWMDQVCEDKTRCLLSERLGVTKAHALLDEGRAVPLQQAARDALR